MYIFFYKKLILFQKLGEIRKEKRPDLDDAEFDITDFIEDVNEECEYFVVWQKIIIHLWAL